MNDERRDASLFIGLHKLAAQNGDGLVPELYALMTARAEAASQRANVIDFPAGRTPRAFGALEGEAGRVLTFRR